MKQKVKIILTGGQKDLCSAWIAEALPFYSVIQRAAGATTTIAIKNLHKRKKLKIFLSSIFQLI
jgi:hypothetical protein